METVGLIGSMFRTGDAASDQSRMKTAVLPDSKRGEQSPPARAPPPPLRLRQPWFRTDAVLRSNASFSRSAVSSGRRIGARTGRTQRGGRCPLPKAGGAGLWGDLFRPGRGPGKRAPRPVRVRGVTTEQLQRFVKTCDNGTRKKPAWGPLSSKRVSPVPATSERTVWRVCFPERVTGFTWR